MALTPDNLEDLVPLVQSIVTKRFGGVTTPTVDREDLVQEGVLGALEAAQRWDPQSGSSFASFIYLRAHGAIQDLLRRQKNGTRRGDEVQVYSLSVLLIDSEEEVDGYGSLAADGDASTPVLTADLRMSLEKALDDLAPGQADPIRLLYFGDEKVTRAQVGKVLGRTENAIYQAVHHGFKKLQARPALTTYAPGAGE